MKTIGWILLSFLLYSCSSTCKYPDCDKAIAGWMKCSDAPKSLSIYCKGEAIHFDEGDYCSQEHAADHQEEHFSQIFE